MMFVDANGRAEHEYHFGVWVDLDDAEKHVVDAGGSYLAGRPTSPNSFYEAKYRDPNGVVFDLTHNGWAGAGSRRCNAGGPTSPVEKGRWSGWRSPRPAGWRSRNDLARRGVIRSDRAHLRRPQQ
jgi:hypothetical protein